MCMCKQAGRELTAPKWVYTRAANVVAPDMVAFIQLGHLCVNFHEANSIQVLNQTNQTQSYTFQGIIPGVSTVQT